MPQKAEEEPGNNEGAPSLLIFVYSCLSHYNIVLSVQVIQMAH